MEDSSTVTEEQDEITHSEAAFDDILKFGRYTVYLTMIFMLSLLTQSLQLLFMTFGGAKPIVDNFVCETHPPVSVEPALSSIEKACLMVTDFKNLYNISCVINTRYKFGSVYEEFNVVCNPNFVMYSTSAQNMGLIFGTLISGFFANTIGRKKTYICTAFLLEVFLITSTFSKTIMFFTFTRFFVMFFTAGSHNVSHIFVIENLPPKFRSIIPSCFSYPLGFMSVAFIAKLSKNWLILTYASAIVTFIPLILLIFTVETPSFLFGKANQQNYSQRRGILGFLGCFFTVENVDEEAYKKHAREFARKWRRKARDAALRIDTFFGSAPTERFEKKWKEAAVCQRIHEIAAKQVEEVEALKSRSSSSFSLFQNPRLLCFTAILSYSIIALGTTNFGTLLALDELPGEIWINLLIAYAFAYVISWLSVSIEVVCAKLRHPLWAGRRQMHIGFACMTTIFVTILFVLNITGKAKSESPVWQWIVCVVAWLMLGTNNQLYIFYHVQSSETFPTPVRAFGCSLVQTASRIGNTIGPLLLVTKKFAVFLPYMTMSAMFFVELFLYIHFSYGCCGRKTEEQCIIRETKGKPKPELMPNQSTNFDDYLQHVKLTESELSELE